MAEGFVREWAGDRIEVVSAGSHPAPDVSRLAAQVMHEVGIDITGHETNSIEEFAGEKFDWVITLCDFARDFCPVFASEDGEAKRLHWSIRDPISATNDPARELEVYRETRDEIARRIAKWLDEEFGIRVVYDPE